MKMRMWNICLFLFLILSLLLPNSIAVPIQSYPSLQHLSHHDECDALFQFRNSLNISRTASLFCDIFPSITYFATILYISDITPYMVIDPLKNSTSYPKTASWKNDTDCCSWDGVTCHTATNDVVGLDLSCSWLQGPLHSNSSLFSLPNLRQLNLAGNDFQGSQVSPRFGIFQGITHLNLSLSNFSGPIPVEMSHLSSLITLDLSGIPGDIIDDLQLRRLLQNLTQLRELAFDGSDLSRISPISLRNLSSTLTSLSIVDCGLRGTFPIDILNLPNLVHLSLFANYDLTGTLPQTNWTSPLISLDLSCTKFHGSIPASLGNMTSMVSLDLSYSIFTGPIPLTLGNLDHLTHLFLGENNFSGTMDLEMFARLRNLQQFTIGPAKLTALLESSGNCSFPRLQYLILSHINLTKFPYFLSSSEELRYLDLSGNMITGRIPEWFWITRRETLTYLDLSSSNFVGEISSSACQVSSLNFLMLSNNKLNGSIPRCLGNLINLRELYLDNNLLQGPLPQSLANCVNLLTLNVGFNRIYDAFPQWLNASYSLKRLDLQSNQFYGVIKIPLPLNLSFLTLSNNNFDGPLPIPPPTIRHYFISNNTFSGDIPHQICNANQLDVIDLSYNGLTGSIPHCFINLSASLSVLDLRANNFVGQIPEWFPLGNNLMTIRLSQNRLGGMLPRTLAHCKNLEVLDLSENELEGSFPYWLGTLPNLQVLVLRSNKFYGPIHRPKTTNRPFPKLCIFDLSNNRFWGPLPAKYIANLVAIKTAKISGLRYVTGSPFYQTSIVVIMKGVETQLVKILTVFTTLDFSSNMFEGEIPEVIVDLKGLKGLNFSHNNLSSSIPSSMGNLTELEWLDLSSNKLDGKIPNGLADLTSLSVLNLSDNQLTGPIPRGPQFDTFNHPFDGNTGLCGYPLPKACESDAGPKVPSTSHEKRETESDDWIEWRSVPIGYGCGLAFGISLGYIMLETMRPRWLVRMIERKRRRKTNKPKKDASPRNHSRRSTG